MKTLITVIGVKVIALTLVNFQCNDNVVEPPPGYPPGYQEDIPWPSLADSPWPIYRGDPQCTGRSIFPGPASGIIQWKIDSLFIKSGVAVGEDSTIYITSMGETSGLIALEPDGKTKWIYPFSGWQNSSPSSPLVAKDGIIYVSSPIDKEFLAVNPDGSLQWKLQNIVVITTGNIGIDGKLYLLSNESGGTTDLVAVSPERDILWEINNLKTYSGEGSYLAFSPDGKTIYVRGGTNTLSAIDVVEQNIVWQLNKGYSIAGPLVDAQGNIYFATQTDTNSVLYSVDKFGNDRWEIMIEESWITDFVMDKNGKIFFGGRNLYCADFNGSLLWQKEINPPYIFSSPLVLDINQRLYFSIDTEPVSILYCYSTNGEYLWSATLDFNIRTGFSFGIGYSSTLIVPSFRSSNLYLVK